MWKRWNQTTHMWERSIDNGQTWSLLPINTSTEAITNNTGLAHGTYFPVASGLVSVSGVSFRESQYLRVGNTVTLSGLMLLTIDVSGSFSVNMSLPINSNLPTNGNFANGTFSGAGTNVLSAAIYSNGPNTVVFVGAGPPGNFFGSYHLTYRVM